MAKSLLFLPDISGYTKFIQTTEVEHSQHVIAELLEILIAANTEDLLLAEVEGDALFFYKEKEIPSQERLLAQIEGMFSAFYSHLALLRENRICPCNACATAPNLELKIIAHAGDLQYIEVGGSRKPFGKQVIEAHRLLKNSIDSSNYVLISRALALEIQMSSYYSSKLFRFRKNADTYDDEEVEYYYSLIDASQLQLQEIPELKKIAINRPPDLTLSTKLPANAAQVMEYLSNYAHRAAWGKGVDEFLYKEHEVTRMGSEHVCVINGKQLHFVVVTKEVQENQSVYGEHATNVSPFNVLYQFYIITPLTPTSCQLDFEIYWEVKGPLKKLLVAVLVKKAFKKNISNAIIQLKEYIANQHQESA